MNRLLLGISSLLLFSFASDSVIDDFANDFESAKTIPFGKTIEGSFDTISDIDMFRVDLATTDTVTITLTNKAINKAPYDIMNFYIIPDTQAEMVQGQLNSITNSYWYYVGKYFSENSLLSFILDFPRDTNIAYITSVKSLNLAQGSYYVVLIASKENYSFDYSLKVDLTNSNSATDEKSDKSCNLTSEFISNLPNGWSLIGSSNAVNDFSMFDSLESVWKYNNSQKSWQHYNPSSTMPPKFNINDFDGLWIKK